MREEPGRTVRSAVALGLALATIAVYASVVRADFLTFDDPVYVVKNDHVRAGLSADSIAWAFRSGEGGNWHPLTWLSHMLDVQLFGLKAGGHHATSLALHVASSVLLLVALDRMTRAFWRSALVAALFALHPLHVESVAWVSERKDVLSTLFFVLVLLAYARYAERPSAGRLLAVVALYALGLMSKPMLVTLPFVLLLLDVWPLDRLRQIGWGRALREKVPLFVLAAAASAVAYSVQETTGAVAPAELVPFPVRVSNAFASCARYLAKTFWPLELAPYYPHPRAIELGPALAGLAVVVAVTVVGVRERARRPYVLVGWLWFLGMLVPVIGLVQVGAQARADRYTYVPLVGVFLVLAWAVPATPRAVAWASAPLLLTLALVARRQVAYWKDTHTLFERALAITEENSIAHKCVGDALVMEGDYAAAIPHLREALRIAPLLADGHNNLGIALGGSGKMEEAVAEYRRELEIRPQSAETRYNLGFALVTLGRVDEGIAEYEAALAISPGLPDVHAKFGAALGSQGEFAEAEREFREELRQRPDSAEAHYNLGFALVNQGRIDEGIAEYEASLALDGFQFAANSKLGIALGSKGRLDEALTHLTKALASRPTDVETRRWVALTLTLQGKVEGAIAEYRKLIEADPDDADSMSRIAWIRATHADAARRDAKEAVELAERARERTRGEDPVVLDTLAAAYAEAGRFDDAVAACEQAIGIARARSDGGEVQRYEQQLALFRAHKPFRIE